MNPSVMTRSLYVSSRDRLAEVAKRRKEHEEQKKQELQDKMRLREERSQKVLERKDQALKDKQSKMKIQESERLKDFNKKRAEQQRRDQERLKEVSKKASSPTKVQSPPKRVSGAAFGSSAPRSLNFGSPSRTVSSTRSAPAKEDAMVRSVYSPKTRQAPVSPKNTAMTRSMYSAPSNRAPRSDSRPVNPKPVPVTRRRSVNVDQRLNSKLPPKPVVKAVSVTKRIVTLDLHSDSAISANISSESIIPTDPISAPRSDNYPDSDNESSNTVELAQPTADLILPTVDTVVVTVAEEIKEPPKLVTEEIPVAPLDELKVSNDVVVEVSEPAVPKAEEVVVNNVESVTEEVEETSIQVSSDEVPSETILESKQESDEEKQIEKEPFVVKAEEPSLPSTNAEEKEEHTPSEAPLIEVEPEAQNVEVPTFDNGDSVDQDLIQPSEFVNGTSATEPEKQLPEPKVEIQKDAENEDPVKQVLNTNGGFHSSNSSPEFGKKDITLEPIQGGAVIGLAEKMEQDRESRRQRMAAILSKNRDSATSSPTLTSSTTATTTVTPLRTMEGMDRIRQLMQKHRPSSTSSPAAQSEGTPYREGPARQSVEDQRQVSSLADEFASLGLRHSPPVLLPGQVPDSN